MDVDDVGAVAAAAASITAVFSCIFCKCFQVILKKLKIKTNSATESYYHHHHHQQSSYNNIKYLLWEIFSHRLKTVLENIIIIAIVVIIISIVATWQRHKYTNTHTYTMYTCIQPYRMVASYWLWCCCSTL